MEQNLTVVGSALDAPTAHDRLLAAVRAAGNTVFADLDQAALAREAGLALRPTYAVIFGNPKAGTAIMAASPHAAFELPLKVVVWSDDEGTHLAYRSASQIGAQYGVTGIDARLAAVDGALAAIVERATG